MLPEINIPCLSEGLPEAGLDPFGAQVWSGRALKRPSPEAGKVIFEREETFPVGQDSRDWGWEDLRLARGRAFLSVERPSLSTREVALRPCGVRWYGV